MLRLFDVVFDSKYPFKEKVTFLKTSINTGFFSDEDVESFDCISKKIKALLNTSSERTEGLLLLHTFLDECCTDAFVQNAASWAHLTLKALKASETAEEKCLACQVFLRLIPLLPAFPSLCKQVSTSVAVALVEAVMRVSPEDEWVEDAFQVLLCCLQTFPGALGASRVKIENITIKHLGEWPEHVLKILAKCVSCLPWCSGGGNQGANHSSAWSAQLTNMLTSLEKMADWLYNGMDIDEDSSPLLLSTLELPQLPDSDHLLSVYCLQKNFQFLGECVLQMLSVHHSTLVMLPLDEIISFIWKALSVNSLEVLEKPTMDGMAIASVIPTVHCVTLSILEALICGIGMQLSAHAHTINHILLRSLIWTTAEESRYGVEKQYSRVRVQTYQVLQAWLESLGPMSAVHHQGEDFVDHFLNDIKSEPDSIQLLSSSGEERPRGRKRKRKQAEMIANSASPQRKLDMAANRELCLGALKGLRSVLYKCGSLLDADLHKRIHSAIIPVLVSIQQESQCGEFTTVPFPYSSIKCRRELYAVLLASVLCPSPNWPPPLQPCVSLFETGCLDHSMKVSSFCCEGQAVLNVVMHPCVTVLQHVEQLEETLVPHSVSSRASNMMAETPVPHEHLHHVQLDSNEEDMDFVPSYPKETIIPQPVVASTNLKKDMAWRIKESTTVSSEQPRQPVLEPQEKVSSMPSTVPIQQQLQQPHGSLVAQQKPGTPPVVTQLLKSHPPQAVQSVPTSSVPLEQQQQLKPQSVKANIIQRTAMRETEDVVVLSEEESGEENHMEEGMEEEDEDEEEEEEEEDEEEEGG